MVGPTNTKAPPILRTKEARMRKTTMRTISVRLAPNWRLRLRTLESCLSPSVTSLTFNT